jgi:hypothetical protein
MFLFVFSSLLQIAVLAALAIEWHRAAPAAVSH